LVLSVAVASVKTASVAVDERSRQLEVAVEIDTTGWLRSGLELRYVLGPNRTIQPTAVHVACNATIDELLAHEPRGNRNDRRGDGEGEGVNPARQTRDAGD